MRTAPGSGPWNLVENKLWAKLEARGACGCDRGVIFSSFGGAVDILNRARSWWAASCHQGACMLAPTTYTSQPQNKCSRRGGNESSQLSILGCRKRRADSPGQAWTRPKRWSLRCFFPRAQMSTPKRQSATRLKHTQSGSELEINEIWGCSFRHPAPQVLFNSHDPSLSRSSASNGSFSNPPTTCRSIALDTRDNEFEGAIPVTVKTVPRAEVMGPLDINPGFATQTSTPSWSLAKAKISLSTAPFRGEVPSQHVVVHALLKNPGNSPS